MNADFKRSRAPIFWLMFGGGGMLSALFGSALVFITGIAAPLENLLSYERVLAFSQHWFGKGLLFVLIWLFAYHAMHRIYHSLHDLGIPTGFVAKLVCYGGAFLITVIAAWKLLAIGF